MQERIRRILEESCAVKQKCAQLLSGEIAAVTDLFVAALERGNKLFFFGNGGSAADAQHLAGEFINRFLYDRRALPAIALSTDSSVLTCVANDSDYSCVFCRQLEALGQAGDIAVGITTSGNSPNVIKALEKAAEMGLKTVGFGGGQGGRLLKAAQYALIIPASVTPRIQEAHITIGHVICELVEERVCPRT